MEHDHRLAGDLARHFQQYEYGSVAAFARAVGADRSTIYRMFDGYAGSKPALLRRIERALSLPDFALDMVKEHDRDGLVASGVDSRILSWVDARLAEGQAEAPHGGRRNASGG